MRKRARVFLPALLLVFLCLAGCTYTEVKEFGSPFDGKWYFAKNAVECRFGDNKIYRDDRTTTAGQSLAGIYTEYDDRIEANLADVGGVDKLYILYLVDDDVHGTVLCDSADGDGTIYFYQSAKAAMAAMVEQDPSKALIAPEEDIPAPAPETEPEASPEAELAASASPEPDSSDESSTPPPEVETLIPVAEPEPTTATRTASGTVWVPKSGSKYHNTPSCSGMKNPSQMSLSEAQSKGYTACKRCYG